MRTGKIWSKYFNCSFSFKSFYFIYNLYVYEAYYFIFLQQAATIAFKLKLQKQFDVTEVTT